MKFAFTPCAIDSSVNSPPATRVPEVVKNL